MGSKQQKPEFVILFKVNDWGIVSADKDGRDVIAHLQCADEMIKLNNCFPASSLRVYYQNLDQSCHWCQKFISPEDKEKFHKAMELMYA